LNVLPPRRREGDVEKYKRKKRYGRWGEDQCRTSRIICELTKGKWRDVRGKAFLGAVKGGRLWQEEGGDDGYKPRIRGESAHTYIWRKRPSTKEERYGFLWGSRDKRGDERSCQAEDDTSSAKDRTSKLLGNR